jgi:uncharacterized protein YqeY
MSLFDKINDDLKTAMKNKDQVTLKAIRAIKSALLLKKTESGDKDVSADEELKILQRLAKQRKESADVYQNQGREDLAKDELDELAVIQNYLPKQLSEEEVEAGLKEIIQEVGAESMKDMGKVMPVAMKKFGGAADGKTISIVLKKLLS